MLLPPLTDRYRRELAYAVYHDLYHATSRVEEKAIGSQLASLMATIINPADTEDEADWCGLVPNESAEDAVFFELLCSTFARTHPVWAFIRLDPSTHSSALMTSSPTPNKPSSTPWLQGSHAFFYGFLALVAGVCLVLAGIDYINHRDFAGGTLWGILLCAGLAAIARYDQLTGAITGFFDGKPKRPVE